MLILLYVITVVLLLVGLWSWRKERQKAISKRISLLTGEGELIQGTNNTIGRDDETKQSFFKRMIEPFWKQFKRSFQRNVEQKKQEKIEQKLLKAGKPFGMTPFEFRLVQVLFLLIFPLTATGLSILLGLSGGRMVLVVLLSFVAGLYFPVFYLKSKTEERNKKAIRELPDFIDLVTVSIEAGLGFDSALSKVVAKKEGVLSSEFQRCLEEMRLGKTRKEALSGVRERLEVDDVKLLIGSIIQAEQLGVGMVQILRVQSNEIRERRKQRAEEAAMKAPIKMLFPLVLFIFPCIFIVLLGPAIIQIFETF
ncbi:type II secretion system F family protein [Bacillus shivajii]|uniref:type II secretion system F family protein n=1 Tax=Bacillus shivajii TaxID=1983719 RepID=UPI001CFB0055|nr:type II secretion system F family protein [Bacillus shivajii]UCZ53139.1 type II secretion system F family protein [Bacillus shivajii]